MTDQFAQIICNSVKNQAILFGKTAPRKFDRKNPTETKRDDYEYHFYFSSDHIRSKFALFRPKYGEIYCRRKRVAISTIFSLF